MISITGFVTDKNCSEYVYREMSITQIKFKIQSSFSTSFPNYCEDNFSKTTKAGHIMHKLAVPHTHTQIIYYNDKTHIILKMILKCESCIESWIFPTFFDWLLYIPGPRPLRVTFFLPRKSMTIWINESTLCWNKRITISRVSITKPKYVNLVVGPAVLSAAKGTQISAIRC